MAGDALTRAALVSQLRALGVAPGGVLLVHCSFRAVRPVEDGPRGLIEALREALGPAGTLVMPSWTGDEDALFDPARTPASPDLGIVADLFWRQPGVMRCDHPEAFAAIGPQAARILADPLPLPPAIPASPVGRVHELNGQVLLLGVGHDANTMIHLAEFLAGVPYSIEHRCTVLRDGQPVRVAFREPDHCCARFALMDDWLRPHAQAEGVVGHARVRLMRARDVVSAATTRLARHPLILLHPPEAGCAECDEARASVAA